MKKIFTIAIIFLLMGIVVILFVSNLNNMTAGLTKYFGGIFIILACMFYSILDD